MQTLQLVGKWFTLVSIIETINNIRIEENGDTEKHQCLHSPYLYGGNDLYPMVFFRVINYSLYPTFYDIILWEKLNFFEILQFNFKTGCKFHALHLCSMNNKPSDRYWGSNCNSREAKQPGHQRALNSMKASDKKNRVGSYLILP